MLRIDLHQGPRDEFDWLFAEADDSESEIASYRDLGDLLVARDDAVVVGLALIFDSGGDGVFELKSLAVDEAWRSRGIGAALVSAVVENCRRRGGRQLRVATAAASIRALQFYQRQGFRLRSIIRDFYSPARGYRPLDINGIPLLDEVILDLELHH